MRSPITHRQRHTIASSAIPQSHDQKLAPGVIICFEGNKALCYSA
jgi:hypothetical protein